MGILNSSQSNSLLTVKNENSHDDKTLDYHNDNDNQKPSYQQPFKEKNEKFNDGDNVENTSDLIIPVGKKVRLKNVITTEWDQLGWVLKREDDACNTKYNIQIINYLDADIDGTKFGVVEI